MRIFKRVPEAISSRVIQNVVNGVFLIAIKILKRYSKIAEQLMVNSYDEFVVIRCANIAGKSTLKIFRFHLFG